MRATSKYAISVLVSLSIAGVFAAHSIGVEQVGRLLDLRDLLDSGEFNRHPDTRLSLVSGWPVSLRYEDITRGRGGSWDRMAANGSLPVGGPLIRFVRSCFRSARLQVR